MLHRTTEPGTNRLSTMASATPSTRDGVLSVMPEINSPTETAAPALSRPARAAQGTAEPRRGFRRANRPMIPPRRLGDPAGSVEWEGPDDMVSPLTFVLMFVS